MAAKVELLQRQLKFSLEESAAAYGEIDQMMRHLLNALVAVVREDQEDLLKQMDDIRLRMELLDHHRYQLIFKAREVAGDAA
ncbi:hypothetical protein [Sphingomonas sanxanigenens]|nr:hypothetical protein [Sphingomonas sanxanigenens]